MLYESVIEREERVEAGTNNNCYAAAMFISDSAGDEEEEVSDVITHDALSNDRAIKHQPIASLLPA